MYSATVDDVSCNDVSCTVWTVNDVSCTVQSVNDVSCNRYPFWQKDIYLVKKDIYLPKRQFFF